MRLKIWPTNLYWDDLEKDTRLIFISIILIYLLISLIKIFNPEPFIKELQIVYLIEKHNELGINNTKGFNLWTPEKDAFKLKYDIEMPFGGIPFDEINGHYAYVSLPPGLILVSRFFYNIFGRFWQIVRIEFIFSGIFLFYGLFVFAIEFVERKKINIFLIFSLTPFSLFHYVYNDINHNGILLSMSLFSYIFLLKYVKSKNHKWFLFSMLFTLFNAWFSYIAFVTIPSFFIHLASDKSFDLKEKIKNISYLFFYGIFIVLTLIIFHSMLPNSLEYLYERFLVRLYSTEGISATEITGSIPIDIFLIRQFIRINTHFNPIAFIFSIVGIFYACKFYIVQFKNKGLIAFDTLNIKFILIMFFFWGVPLGFLVVNGAYIHAYSILYFNLFFILGASIGYTKIFDIESLQLRQLKNIKYFSVVIIQIFLFVSISRALMKVSELSLIDIFFNGDLPKFWG